MRVVVTGGRNYQDMERLYEVLDGLGVTSLAHGACPTGADAWASCWAMERLGQGHGFPADWQGKGRAAGPIRNGYMLRHFKPDLVVAFPGGKGTEDCVRQAEALGIKVLRVE